MLIPWMRPSRSQHFPSFKQESAKARHLLQKVEIHLSNGQWKNALWDLRKRREQGVREEKELSLTFSTKSESAMLAWHGSYSEQKSGTLAHSPRLRLSSSALVPHLKSVALLRNQASNQSDKSIQYESRPRREKERSSKESELISSQMAPQPTLRSILSKTILSGRQGAFRMKAKGSDRPRNHTCKKRKGMVSESEHEWDRGRQGVWLRGYAARIGVATNLTAELWAWAVRTGLRIALARSFEKGYSKKKDRAD